MFYCSNFLTKVNVNSHRCLVCNETNSELEGCQFDIELRNGRQSEVLEDCRFLENDRSAAH
jgi:hypothetical protein